MEVTKGGMKKSSIKRNVLNLNNKSNNVNNAFLFKKNWEKLHPVN